MCTVKLINRTEKRDTYHLAPALVTPCVKLPQRIPRDRGVTGVKAHLSDREVVRPEFGKKKERRQTGGEANIHNFCMQSRVPGEVPQTTFTEPKGFTSQEIVERGYSEKIPRLAHE